MDSSLMVNFTVGAISSLAEASSTVELINMVNGTASEDLMLPMVNATSTAITNNGYGMGKALCGTARLGTRGKANGSKILCLKVSLLKFKLVKTSDKYLIPDLT